jgi:hypothetical protein
MVSTPAGTVLIAARAAERRVVERLRQLGATSPDSAQQLPGLSPIESRRLARLVRLGVAGEISPGMYYLNVEAMREREAARQPVRVFLLGLLFIALLLLGLFLSTHAF